jgi:hypothetical protein
MHISFYLVLFPNNLRKIHLEKKSEIYSLKSLIIAQENPLAKSV